MENMMPVSKLSRRATLRKIGKLPHLWESWHTENFNQYQIRREFLPEITPPVKQIPFHRDDKESLVAYIEKEFSDLLY